MPPPPLPLAGFKTKSSCAATASMSDVRSAKSAAVAMVVGTGTPAFVSQVFARILSSAIGKYFRGLCR